MNRVLVFLVAVFIAQAAAAAEEKPQPVAPPEKSRLLVIRLAADEGVSKDDVEILDGLVCSGASAVKNYSVTCAGSIQDMSQFKGFSQQFGGNACSKGLCLEALVGKYNPELIIQPKVARSGSGYEFAFKLIDGKGTYTIVERSRKVKLSDPAVQQVFGETLAALVADGEASMKKAAEEKARLAPVALDGGTADGGSGIK